MSESLSVPVALALGSNLGDRLGFLRQAVHSLRSLLSVRSVSPVYETAPAYVFDQPVFLNAVLVGTTALEPVALLWAVKHMESDIGRRPTFRYGPRIIDIDILFYGDTVLKTPELTIPHARIQERDFVLRPLADIEPLWRHPLTQKTAEDMLGVLPKGNLTCLGDLLP
ncbi:MAG: 2-amino-4-hydroxy-6-hydroxymethyldihydropteridine diphosphokinase [Alphaproteobacteria bacterium]|nr:2-amino-4-hydroxy-6-hydroxymethyldihydropteridine diphosphokinase [Alphaproteobacteria bacterium]